MELDIEPAAVTKMGRAARHVGETMIGVVPRELADGKGDAAAARIGELATSAALSECLETWTLTGKGMSDTVSGCGDNLVQTANIASTTDDDSGDLFARVATGGMRPI